MLNLVFLAGSAVLGWILWHDPDRPEVGRKDDVIERVLFWVALAAATWLVGGLAVAPLLT